MTTPNRRSLGFVARRALFAAVLAAGCSRQPQPAPESPAPDLVQPVALVTPSAAVAPSVPSPTPEAQPAVPPTPPAPVEPPPTFKFAPDLTGQALSKVSAPAVPVKLPGERFGNEPKPRQVPAKYLNPDALARSVHTPLPVLVAKPAPTKPTSPTEKVPLTLGAGADDLPTKIVLPVAPVVTERARDVSAPPPAPALGRQNTERVPFDDPTSEVGNAVVVANAVPVQLGVSGFLKVTVPDPFELAEQIKPSVPAPAEPSAKPVEVNPQRVK